MNNLKIAQLANTSSFTELNPSEQKHVNGGIFDSKTDVTDKTFLWQIRQNIARNVRGDVVQTIGDTIIPSVGGKK